MVQHVSFSHAVRLFRPWIPGAHILPVVRAAYPAYPCSQVRFGANMHSSPPLSFLPAPRPSTAAGGGSAVATSNKSLPPFSLLDFGGDSRGSLGAAARVVQ